MADPATAAHAASHGGPHHGADESRRDFLLLSTLTIGATGAALAAWPLVDMMNPSKDVLALATTEVDVAPIEPGQSITVVWRGKPVFIRHRTPGEIQQAQKEMGEKEPQADSSRVKKDQWLVVVGICTHLGCIPLGQRSSEPKGKSRSAAVRLCRRYHDPHRLRRAQWLPRNSRTRSCAGSTRGFRSSASSTTTWSSIRRRRT
jgi:ubiquinol-cytochrome c reductase iron-sulfur subunit